MPARYEALRDQLMRAGHGRLTAKGEAARMFNKNRKEGEAPVTRYHRKKKKKKT